MQGLFRSRENIGSFQYPVLRRTAKTTRERHRLPLKNSVEPRAQHLGERRIEVAFEQSVRLCRALRTRASYPRCPVRPHPRARGSSLAGAGAAAHGEPARRACNLAVMTKGGTDKLRPSLLPVLRSFNRRVEGRHEETHRYRHQVLQGILRCAQLHLAQERTIPAASAALDHIVVFGSVRRSL